MNEFKKRRIEFDCGDKSISFESDKNNATIVVDKDMTIKILGNVEIELYPNCYDNSKNFYDKVIFKSDKEVEIVFYSINESIYVEKLK